MRLSRIGWPSAIVNGRQPRRAWTTKVLDRIPYSTLFWTFRKRCPSMSAPKMVDDPCESSRRNAAKSVWSIWRAANGLVTRVRVANAWRKVSASTKVCWLWARLLRPWQMRRKIASFHTVSPFSLGYWGWVQTISCFLFRDFCIYSSIDANCTTIELIQKVRCESSRKYFNERLVLVMLALALFAFACALRHFPIWKSKFIHKIKSSIQPRNHATGFLLTRRLFRRWEYLIQYCRLHSGSNYTVFDVTIRMFLHKLVFFIFLWICIHFTLTISIAECTRHEWKQFYLKHFSRHSADIVSIPFRFQTHFVSIWPGLARWTFISWVNDNFMVDVVYTKITICDKAVYTHWMI